jgi:hypothetical protein
MCICAEDPKRFLREVKAGIGDPVSGPGSETISFYDAAQRACWLRCEDSERLMLSNIDSPVTLSRNQAQRLANTLEHWAASGCLGAGPGKVV